jgi:hypothetical protein
MQVKSQMPSPRDGREIPVGNCVIGGIAFGGRYGIGRVQVSLDDGAHWQDATMKKPLSSWSWVLWSYQGRPQKKGSYTLKVRGFDRSG